MGREVEKLFIGELGTGNYSLQWNAEDKPSGTYFARLTAGENTQTIKMILTK